MLLSRKLKENLERTIEQRREEGARALYEWFERRDTARREDKPFDEPPPYLRDEPLREPK